MQADALLPLLTAELPIRLVDYTPPPTATGLVVVDEVNGFCTVGGGSMAPASANAQVTGMIGRTEALARRAVELGWPILAFLDTHEPGRPEPPYPAHCERGSGEENLVAELAWLDDEPTATLVRKDCINGFVGAIEPVFHPGAHGCFHNRLIDWVLGNRLEALVVTGICTDICVMDLVLTMLSARNHDLMPTLRDIVVLEPACATYDLPRASAEALGLPASAVHPQAEAHHLGLYMMAARGAVLAGSLRGV